MFLLKLMTTPLFGFPRCDEQPGTIKFPTKDQKHVISKVISMQPGRHDKSVKRYDDTYILLSLKVDVNAGDSITKGVGGLGGSGVGGQTDSQPRYFIADLCH
jgi:hypothetical protein